MYKLKERIESAFRAKGLRRTAQRFFVMEHLMRNRIHETAEEIFVAVNRSDPRASRATVYNNLHALEDAGLVRGVAVDGKAARFDANVDKHHHFICDVCGGVEDVQWFDPPEIAHPVRDFEAVFRGECASCLAFKTQTALKKQSTRIERSSNKEK